MGDWHSTALLWGKSEPFIVGGTSSKEADLAHFSSITIDGPFDVDVRFIPHQHFIHMTGNVSLVALTNSFVENDTLHVVIDPTYQYSPQMKVLLTVEVPMLDRMYYRGSGRVSLMGIDGENFVLNADGSGYFYITGKLIRFDASIGGTSRLNAKCLKSRTIFVNTGGMAQAEVATQGYLSAIAGDSSDIYYYQNPKLAVPFTVSSGSVMRMEAIADPYLPCEYINEPRYLGMQSNAMIPGGYG